MEEADYLISSVKFAICRLKASGFNKKPFPLYDLKTYGIDENEYLELFEYQKKKIREIASQLLKDFQ